MINIEDFAYQPDLNELCDYVGNELFIDFCDNLMAAYHVKPKIEFSKCSWERGWNMKLKKASKTLGTIYFRKNYFTVLVVIGKREKELVEKNLKNYCTTIQNIYTQSKEGNGQRWLMIDLKKEDLVYQDCLALLKIRYHCQFEVK